MSHDSGSPDDDGERKEWLRMQALVMRMRPTLPQPGSEQFHAGVAWWSKGVAELAVDALVHAGLVRREDFDRAEAMVAEEVLVRLAIGDYPPTREPDTPN